MGKGDSDSLSHILQSTIESSKPIKRSMREARPHSKGHGSGSTLLISRQVDHSVKSVLF